ncbi:NTP transferase domain-containing protein [Streptomyces sp. CB01881]|uniref:nucleotidyltransferase family protein n=1 Tax=Streptomyces sp. CB01881 TaxID=2078691 RepID=UPI000CDCB78F|nr:NTP transferase domain-containing protein [Streptomyces sp. CB01881]AUY52291.1 4-diphosphocytidyl-2C-methyl-D-erythritol synthase [Streptomyces sp. CB01881]TYC71713.1 nucleotidyltransferase family protein [Streptomyces sp. CB01881]
MQLERPVAALVLAAGGGRRLGGRPKALIPYRGRPLVEHAVATVRAGGCPDVTVVLGAARERVRATAHLPGCRLVENPDWADGMGSSLRAGLATLAPSTPAVLVMLVDTPGVTAAAVARLVAAHRAGAGLAAAAYGGRRGHPVLIGARYFGEAAAGATGDAGARALLAAHPEDLTLVECADVAVPDDLDTPADLARWSAG